MNFFNMAQQTFEWDEIRYVRRAAAKQFNIKRIMMNCFKYVNAPCTPADHLMRYTITYIRLSQTNAVVDFKLGRV